MRRTTRAAVHDVATILIVEDEAVIALGASMILEDAGHHVVLAPDGEAGLGKVRELAPDLILTDYMMPRMDGLAMITVLRREGLETPVLLATSIAEDFFVKSGFVLYDHYLAKPYDEAGLLSAVQSLLGSG